MYSFAYWCALLRWLRTISEITAVAYLVIVIFSAWVIGSIYYAFRDSSSGIRESFQLLIDKLIHPHKLDC